MLNRFSIGFFLGALVTLWVNQCQLFFVIFSSIFILSFLLGFLPRNNKLIILLGFCSGLAWLLFFNHQLNHNIYPVGSGQTKIQIISMPEYNYFHTEFNAKLLNQSNPVEVTVNWYGKHPKLIPGQVWLLDLNVKKKHGISALPYEATVQTKDKNQNKLISSSTHGFYLEKLRQNIKSKLYWDSHKNPLSNLLIALSIGDKGEINKKQWRVLQHTGTSHLMSISGLHMGLVAGFFYFLAKLCWKVSVNLKNNISKQKFAAILAMLTSIIYALIAGFALPTQRALIMVLVVFISILFDKAILPWQAFLRALLCILIFEPLCIYQHSFWLSFMAVGVIIYGLAGRVNPQGLWWHYGRVQWVIGLGFMPISLLVFHSSSLVGFIANAIAIPWVSFFVVPLLLINNLLISLQIFKLNIIITKLIYLSLVSINIIWWVLNKLSQWPHALWEHRLGLNYLFFSSLLGVLLLLAPKGFPNKGLGCFLLLPLLIPHHYAIIWPKFA